MVKDPQSLHMDLVGADGPDVDVDYGVTWPAKKEDHHQQDADGEGPEPWLGCYLPGLPQPRIQESQVKWGKPPFYPFLALKLIAKN
jgi:hypothetical protein